MGLAAPVLGSLRQGEAAAEKAQIQAQSLLLGARPRHDDSTNDHSKGAGPVPAGLAERSTNPDDGRSVLAAITPEGRRVALAAAAALNAQVFADVGLDPAEHAATLQVLATWRQAFGDFR